MGDVSPTKAGYLSNTLSQYGTVARDNATKALVIEEEEDIQEEIM